MTAPVISTVSFDKSLYGIGDTITATVTYASENLHGGQGDVLYALVVTATDTITGETTTATAGQFSVDTGAQVPNLDDLSATDNRTPPGGWTLVSNTMSGNTGTAVFTSTA